MYLRKLFSLITVSALVLAVAVVPVYANNGTNEQADPIVLPEPREDTQETDETDGTSNTGTTTTTTSSSSSQSDGLDLGSLVVLQALFGDEGNLFNGNLGSGTLNLKDLILYSMISGSENGILSGSGDGSNLQDLVLLDVLFGEGESNLFSGSNGLSLGDGNMNLQNLILLQVLFGGDGSNFLGGNNGSSSLGDLIILDLVFGNN